MYSGLMSCIPDSGGCERRATDVLVAHLNSVEGTRYEHRACLDRIDATQAQPECLYIDASRDQRLVIERKSIMWPEDYAYQHSKYHDLANNISAELKNIDFQDTYVLRVPALNDESKQELRDIAHTVAQAIYSQYASLKPGQDLTIRCNRYAFRFGIQPVEERDDGTPTKGLGFSWTTDDAWSLPADLQDRLHPQIGKIYRACEKKFSEYASDRRVLMLDPYGGVAFNPLWWWNEVFAKHRPPSAIDEIWIVSPCDDGFGEVEWTIEKVFGRNLSFAEPPPESQEQ